jgi:hypothetical protein
MDNGDQSGLDRTGQNDLDMQSGLSDDRIFLIVGFVVVLSSKSMRVGECRGYVWCSSLDIGVNRKRGQEAPVLPCHHY